MPIFNSFLLVYQRLAIPQAPPDLQHDRFDELIAAPQTKRQPGH